MKHVIKPMAKYLAVVFVGIIIIAMAPPLTTWLPGSPAIDIRSCYLPRSDGRDIHANKTLTPCQIINLAPSNTV
jgi:hypothetical protein